ncbi:MAG: hypothetical protein WAU88_08360 [Candidatus Zixiibacteriota bacterium]
MPIGQKNLHFSLCMKYEDALKAVRIGLVRNGFGIVERHDGRAKTDSNAAYAPGRFHEFTVFEGEQDRVQATSLGSADSLPRVVVCASHGGFAEVFLRQAKDEVDSSVLDSSLRMARAMLDAGKSAFLPREIDPNGSDLSDLPRLRE